MIPPPLPALADAYWPDVDRAEREVLIIPVGSTEQHGPHLPLHTDAFLAQAIAERVYMTRPAAGLAPTVPFGASGEHADFPGTLSIGTDVLSQLIVELVRHATRDWPAVLIVNGHGGNTAALREATRLCRYEKRRLAVTHLVDPRMDAHAGWAETSMMLHLAPERVRLDEVGPGTTTRLEILLPTLREHGVRAVSANGVLGDPTRATAAAGESLVAALVASATGAYDRCAALT